MSSNNKTEIVEDYSSNSTEVLVTNFINDLRLLLDKHSAKLYTSNCELYINKLGFVGNLEDNIETIEITDGDEVLFTSTIRKI
tara:strand:- start:61 stop:309 length:249 start_codon:yes stop_codon:yes gene_type:complete